jgi:hypothetical protein
MSGMTAIIVYSKQLLASIFPALQPLLGSLTMLLYFIFSIMSLEFSEKYGRKRMTLIGAWLLFMANYCIAFGFMIY